MIINIIKLYKELLLSVLLCQSVFSQSTYSSMSAREKINYNTKQLSNCKSCELFYFGRGLAKVDVGDLEGAIEDFRKANSSLGSGSTFASGHIASVLRKMNNFSGAIIEYTKMINNRDLGLSDIYFDRAICKLTLKDYRGAISDFDMSIELNPKDKFAYYNRGAAKYNLNQKNSACMDWSKAGELGFSDAYNAIQEYCN